MGSKMNGSSESEAVSLREANDDDIELMMAWRSNPLVYCGFYSQHEPLKYKEHYAWWKSRRNRRDWIIVLDDGEHTRDVGVVNVSSLDSDSPEVGVYVGEVTAWGRAIGRRAVSLAIHWLHANGYKKARALVLKDNPASLSLFEAVGFRRISEGREGEWVYELGFQP